MEYTGKIKLFKYNGKSLRLYNQSSTEWTHPYNYPSIPSEANDDLHTAGCGIFAVAHLIDYMSGSKIDVEALADFSMLKGGRGDDGTDRPVLLEAMEKCGRLAPYRLRYECDGNRNDSELLWKTLQENGAALCDLRVGHIVAVVDWRVVNGEKQVLIMDSSRDSIHRDVIKDVRECVAGTEIVCEYTAENGTHCGLDEHFAMFWVPYTKPYDFNLLHRVND